LLFVCEFTTALIHSPAPLPAGSPENRRDMVGVDVWKAFRLLHLCFEAGDRIGLRGSVIGASSFGWGKSTV
jgi:hypothetical protein